MTGKISPLYVALTIVAVVIYFSIKGSIGSRNRDVRRVMPVRFWVWRFFTGKMMDGSHPTNGTFRYRGNAASGNIVKATNWQYRAGYERLLIRLAVLSYLTVYPFAYIFDLSGVFGVMTVLAAVFIGIYIYKMIRAAVRFHINWKWIEPLHHAIHKDVGRRHDERGESYIHFPHRFRRDTESEGIIDLPEKYNDTTEGKRNALANVIGTKLGLTDVEVTFHLESRNPYLTFFRSPPPPDAVLYVDVAELIQQCEHSAAFLGYTSRLKPVYIEVNEKSPHVLMSARTGAGKSELLKSILSQYLARGYLAIICDLKRISHMWAKGLPGVIYCTNEEEIHKALIVAEQQVSQRYDMIEQSGSIHTDVGPGVIVVVDEMNATMDALAEYWKGIRTSKNDKKSPAVIALNRLSFMGRAAKVHLFVLGNYGTVRSVGSSATRENFAIRILAQHTQNAWRMLIPEHWPPPKAGKEPGRVFLAHGLEVTEVQVVYLTDLEARTLALTSPQVITNPELTKPVKDEPAPDTAEIDMLATLKEACEWKWIPITYDAARKRKSREKDKFPRGAVNSNGDVVYSRVELEDWYYDRQPTE